MGLDQLTKALARHIGMVKASNTGSVFGLLKGTQGFLIVLSFAVLLALLLFYRRLGSAMQKTAVVLMISGIIGNTVDRVAAGAVTDFISVPFWPAFNFADSFIVVGAILLLASAFLPVKKKPAKKKR